MVRFEANLSEKSLEKVMAQLEEHGKKLMKAQEYVLDALATYVYDRIIFYVPVDTGQLMNSFVKETMYYYSYAVARVYTDLYYAKYVEFGTGVRGTSSEYDTSKIGNINLSYNEEIQGQVAQKFIYQAVLDLERDYVEIATNVLREKGLI